jgi:hypothetical protein
VTRIVRCCIALLGIGLTAAMTGLMASTIGTSTGTLVGSDKFATTAVLGLCAGAMLLVLLRELRWPTSRVHAQAAPIRFRVLPIYRAGIGVPGAFFLAAGLWIQFNQDEANASGGITWIVLGSIWVVFSIFRYKSHDKTLAISTLGLDFSAFNTGPIPWTDIARAELKPYRPWSIRIELVDKEKYMDRLTDRWRHGLLLLTTWEFGLPPEQVLEVMRTFLPTTSRDIASAKATTPTQSSRRTTS